MIKKILLSAVLLFCGMAIYAQNLVVENGSWVVSCNESSKDLEIKHKGLALFSKAYAKASYSLEKTATAIDVTSLQSSAVTLSEKAINDNFGNGKQYTFTYTLASNISLEQHFYFYDNLPYFLLEANVSSSAGIIFSNYVAPLVSETANAFLASNRNNRMLWAPWDNDAWVRYQSYELNRSMTSHEVTAIFSGDSRLGLVVGSVEHDAWKSGISVDASGNNSINKIAVFSGHTSEFTRDVLPHGKLKGASVKSAKFMVGYFDDWRAGMDQFGEANTTVVPRWEWKGATPFGWSSWGGMQDKISYAGVLDVSEYLKNELFDKGFHDADGKTVLSLDAWWNDNISAYGIKDIPKKLATRDQVAGIYTGPFCDWARDPERIVDGTNGQYRYKDIWLYVNGKPHEQGGICIDPTHPGTKMAMKYNMEQYKSWGYKYIKVDFQTNGAIEADSYYNPEVTTGTQAYNEGMKYYRELAGDDVYIVLAISPIFPYQYAHGRRTSCDSFSKIDETEYVMNSTSFGWWTNKIYQVNDPDHLVMRFWDKVESYGENRARATSGAVTGAYIFGDNFSDKVNTRFPAESRERALSIMTNNDVNEIPRTCGTFKPVEGYIAGIGGAENLLTYETEEYVYLACINYYPSIKVVNGTMTFERLGIDPANVSGIKELWTGADVKINNNAFTYAVAPADARIYRITKKDGVGIDEEKADEGFRVSVFPNLLIINSYDVMKHASLYNLSGSLVKSATVSAALDAEINVASLPSGTYILKVDFDSKEPKSQKILIK